MKIASIDIKEFRQFKNLKLDLIYPKGHEKAGEPLDKVCIIGQSGTGKTNLLELIYGRTLIPFQGGYFEQFTKSKFGFTDKTGAIEVFDFDKTYSSSLSVKKPDIYFFPIQLKSPLNTTHNEGENHKLIHSYTSEKLWKDKIQDYQEHANERSKFVFAVSNAFGKKSQEEVQQLIVEKENWEKENPNPLDEIAALLDPIISKFGLNARMDITSLKQLEFISLIDKDGDEVPQNLWSTGTNQIIYKTYPLFALKPENAIILIDEPENSLYPDIQTEIIEHYTRLAPTSQFFFATHSPIIASCFEPWEIVELKFNEDGEVFRELYYQGENHIDNYFVDPRYLSVNSILLNIFDYNINPFRYKQLIELAKIDDKLQGLKQNGKGPENVDKIKDLIEQYNALANKLDWEIEYAKD